MRWHITARKSDWAFWLPGHEKAVKSVRWFNALMGTYTNESDWEFITRALTELFGEES